jgi:2-oxoglutarate dehydrogenase E2 component (dihydrolipoamide succinyltransferase)
MMYLALSYDHRIIDGKDSVSFLVKIKQLIESPYKMLLGTNSVENLLLDI